MENNSMGNKVDKSLKDETNQNNSMDEPIKIRERTKSCDKISAKCDSRNKGKQTKINSNYF